MKGPCLPRNQESTDWALEEVEPNTSMQMVLGLESLQSEFARSSWTTSELWPILQSKPAAGSRPSGTTRCQCARQCSRTLDDSSSPAQLAGCTMGDSPRPPSLDPISYFRTVRDKPRAVVLPMVCHVYVSIRVLLWPRMRSEILSPDTLCDALLRSYPT